MRLTSVLSFLVHNIFGRFITGIDWEGRFRKVKANVKVSDDGSGNDENVWSDTIAIDRAYN